MVPEGATVSLGGAYSGTITYLANWTGTAATSTLSGGNDVAIYNAIPEPGALAFVTWSALLLARRRRGAS